MGCHSGLLKQVKTVAPAAVWNRCIVLRQVLATEKMQMELRELLDEAVITVNLIKSRTMNARVFSILCAKMGTSFKLRGPMAVLRQGPHPPV